MGCKGDKSVVEMQNKFAKAYREEKAKQKGKKKKSGK